MDPFYNGTSDSSTFNEYQSSNSEFAVHGQYSLQTDQFHETNHYQEMSELSTTDGVLRYVDRMLMEDDADDDEENRILIESSTDFQAKERSFYELLGQEYPPPPPQQQQQDPPPPDRSSEVAVSMNFRDDQYWTADDNNNPHSDDEFDTWTYADGGCQAFAAHLTDLRNASKLKSQTEHDHIKKKKEEVDIRSLLISCAQSVASLDQAGANEFLRQLRPHLNQFGHVDQRLAHYFVRGLEARLAGTGPSIPNKPAFVYETMSASDYLTAYCTSLISSSFRRISIFASNNLIASRSKRFARVHIIDFGILYGFQWPPFIQRLSEREGGPPKLRITGIDFPQEGGELAEKNRETGDRLAQYAEMFGVPFEYNSIAKSWESIRVEDLEIEEGEYVAVNCLYRAESLMPDEMAVTESPRSKFLELVRKMNPDVFVNGIVHGGFGIPYFVTRFREALFFYSALFDMAETIIPNGRPERMVLEGILGNEAMNVVACEGGERVVRPETARQWQLRHVRAGLKQVPLGRSLVEAIVKKVRICCHREFLVAEDQNKWLMMSWKGKTISALSCWQPNNKT